MDEYVTDEVQALIGIESVPVTAADPVETGSGIEHSLIYILRNAHWADQLQGLKECARMLQDGGPLVLAELFGDWLAPTTVLGRRGRTRTIRRASRLLVAAGFSDLGWQRLYDLGPLPLVQAVTAAR